MDNKKIGHHISGQFNKELEEVRDKVLVMGGLVEQQIELAIRAFSLNDMELAELVIKQDNQIDALEVDIDAECTQILALRQPTAFDLRLVLTVLKVINELEVVGDLAKRIAKMAIQSSDVDGKTDQYYEIDHMADLVKSMLHGALDAFARMNIDNITSITERVESVDREYASIVRQLITRMMEDPRNITRTLSILWTVRAMERIGDHACYICEHLIFMVKGESVRHLTQRELEEKMKN
jgi:phosphate transport system protein